MIFLFPIEIKNRELFSKVFLSFKLLEKGHKVIIGSQRDIPQNISKISNCFWFDKNTFISKINKNTDMKYIKKNYIGMLDEEGPLAFFNSTSRDLRYPKNIRKYYDYLFVWGLKDREKINFLKSKVSILGHPKYDLLKKPFINIWDKEVKLLKKKYKEFILFNSSFKSRPSKENYRKSIVTLRDNLSDQKKFKKSLKTLDTIFDAEEKNYIDTINLLKELSNKNKNINFIFRPHPNENVNTVKRKFGKIPKNLKIVYKGPVTPWILSTKLLIHSGCTTAFEGAVLRKKIICFIPNGNFDRYKIYSKIGNFFNDKNLLVKKFDQILFSKKSKLDVNFVNSFIANSKYGNFFFKEFIKFLKKNKLNQIYSKYYISDIETNIIKIYIYRIKQKLKKLLSKVKDFLIQTPLIYLFNQKYIYSKKSRDKKIKYLKKNEILKIFNQLNKVNPHPVNIQIRKISENVFIASKKPKRF